MPQTPTKFESTKQLKTNFRGPAVPISRCFLLIHKYNKYMWKVAIESWPEWDLNPRPLNSIQTLQPTELSGHEFN